MTSRKEMYLSNSKMEIAYMPIITIQKMLKSELMHPHLT